MNNEKPLERAIKDFDRDLELCYSENEGFYYISRPFSRFDEKDAAEILQADSTCFAEALKKRHLVVCYPIPVVLLEEFEIAHRNVMRHLHDNDLKKLAATPSERVRVQESKYDNEASTHKATKKFSDSQDMQAYGRDYYRRKVQQHAYFGGIPRMA